MPHADTKKRRRSRKVHIGVFTRLETNYGQEIAGGVQRFARTRSRWKFCSVDHIDRFLDFGWRELGLDGVIGEFAEKHAASIAPLRESVPALVGVAAEPLADPAVFPVHNDHFRSGELAVRFFSLEGFTSFAYAGPRNAHSAREHESGMRHGLAATNPPPLFESLPIPLSGVLGTAQKESLRRQLKKLPIRTAVFAGNEGIAGWILDLCRETDIPVPGSLSILGIGSGPAAGSPSAMTPLSRIEVRSGQIGFEAARRIDRMTRVAQAAQTTVDPAAVTVAPIHIIEGATTEGSRLGDQLVSEVYQFIQNNAAGGITVGDVVAKFDLPRRTLERRFRRAINTSMHQEILLRQLKEAQRLLAETRLPIAEVASRSGFSEPRLLNLALKRHTGSTPSAFRDERSPHGSKP